MHLTIRVHGSYQENVHSSQACHYHVPDDVHIMQINALDSYNNIYCTPLPTPLFLSLQLLCYYQTVQSYCLSRDCPKTDMRHLKCHLKNQHTSGRKSPLWNNISPSNMKYIFKNMKSLTGGWI